MSQTSDEFHETLQRLRGGDIKVQLFDSCFLDYQCIILHHFYLNYSNKSPDAALTSERSYLSMLFYCYNMSRLNNMEVKMKSKMESCLNIYRKRTQSDLLLHIIFFFSFFLKYALYPFCLCCLYEPADYAKPPFLFVIRCFLFPLKDSWMKNFCSYLGMHYQYLLLRLMKLTAFLNGELICLVLQLIYSL